MSRRARAFCRCRSAAHQKREFPQAVLGDEFDGAAKIPLAIVDPRRRGGAVEPGLLVFRAIPGRQEITAKPRRLVAAMSASVRTMNAAQRSGGWRSRTLKMPLAMA